MKCVSSYVTLPALLFLSGAVAFADAAEQAAPRLRLAGIVVKSKTGTGYGFADFDESSYDGAQITKSVSPHRKFKTTQYLKIEVAQESPNKNHDFIVVFGPDPDPNVSKKASGKIMNTEVEMELTSGWAYLSGDYPNTTTKTDSNWVSTGAQGTKIVVRIDDKTNDHYVYLLKDNATAAKVNYKTCDGSVGSFDNSLGKGWFIRVQKCEVKESKELDATAEAWLNTIDDIYKAAE